MVKLAIEKEYGGSGIQPPDFALRDLAKIPTLLLVLAILSHHIISVPKKKRLLSTSVNIIISVDHPTCS